MLAAADEELIQMYAEGTLRQSNGVLVINSSKIEPSDLESLKGAESWLDFSTVRVVLGGNCGDYSLRKVPKGNVIPTLILRTYTGRPVSTVQKTVDLFKIESLSESDYAHYMSSHNTPTVDLNIYTTKR